MFDQLQAIVVALVGIVAVTTFYVVIFRVSKPKAGIVMDRRFTPAREAASLQWSYGIHGAMPPHLEPSDDWAIKIVDEGGYTNWIHVDKDVFERHPRYSYFSQR